MRQEQEIKEIQIGKEVKLSLFSNDMTLCLKDMKNTKKLLDIINTFSIVARYKINIQK
jgi:hypothetical protein